MIFLGPIAGMHGAAQLGSLLTDSGLQYQPVAKKLHRFVATLQCNFLAGCMKPLTLSLAWIDVPLCVNFGTWSGLPVSKLALVSEAGLIVDLILLQGRRPLPENHLAGQVLKVGIHGQRQAKLVGEEVLCGDLRKQEQFCERQHCYACYAMASSFNSLTLCIKDRLLREGCK